MSFLIDIPVVSCKRRAMAKPANTTVRWGLDRLLLAVKDWSSFQVAFRPSERTLRPAMVVVRVDNRGAGYLVDVKVGDVPVQACELPCLVDRGLA